MLKIKKGDTVKVILGKDKGKEGKVGRIFSGSKIVVEGLNQFKKHIKGNSASGQKSEIITLVRPYSLGAVVLVCPKCKKMTRVGFLVKEGKKSRICRKCKKEI